MPATGFRLIARPAWFDKKNCAEVPTGYFVAMKTADESSDQYDERLRVVEKCCASCKVTWECLDWAFKYNETELILGGTTPGDREELLSLREILASEQAALSRSA